MILSSPSEVLDRLVAMSREIGDPARDCAILGEGNSSAAVDDETFYVKASGASLHNAGPDSFVRVRFDAVLAIVDDGPGEDARVAERLNAARVDPSAVRRPSVETTFHACLLSLPGVGFIGHSHPTAVNALLCSTAAPAIFEGRLFPDEIVCCGPEPVWIPYVDPGVPLSIAVRNGANAYLDRWSEAPRVILMQNHGLIALGATPAEVLSATFMMVKTARVLLGAASVGDPRTLTPENVARIHGRPDEHYRRKILRGDA